MKTLNILGCLSLLLGLSLGAWSASLLQPALFAIALGGALLGTNWALSICKACEEPPQEASKPKRSSIIWYDREGFELQRRLCKTESKSITARQALSDILSMWDNYGPYTDCPEVPGWYYTIKSSDSGLVLHTALRYWDGSAWSRPCKPSDSYATREVQLSRRVSVNLVWFNMSLAIDNMLPCGSFRYD